MAQKYNQYEFLPFSREWMVQTVELLQHLWGTGVPTGLEHFRWKYLDNPFTETPIGVVARHAGRVVGFKGYFTNRYEIPNRRKDIGLLIPCDSCVHPDHRLKGLSVQLTYTAIEAFGARFKLFLSMTSNRRSLPGSFKTGFVPLAKKAYLSRYRAAGFLKYIVYFKKKPDPDLERFPSGSYDHIQVSHRAEPAKMAALVKHQHRDEARIRLVQDEAFFRWRFSNHQRKYNFYYHATDGRLNAYAVMGLSRNHRRGFLLDFARQDETAMEDLLRFIVGTQPYDLISIWHFSPDRSLRKILKNTGFRKNTLARLIEKKLIGELPLLIRPLVRDYTTQDFVVGGLDTRRIENWRLKEICSDDA